MTWPYPLPYGGPATQPTIEAAKPDPSLPCRIDYYGIDCTGCPKHPQGFKYDDFRSLRRAGRTREGYRQ